MATITYGDEASESFAHNLQHIAGYTVRITPKDGEPFDAVVIGSARDETGDHFGVLVRRWTHDEGMVGERFVVVVKDIHIH